MPENLEHFHKYFGDDLAKLEKDLVAHLKKQDYTSPVATLPHFVARIEYRDGRKRVRRGGFFYEESQANQWLQDYLQYLDGDQRADAKYDIIACPNRREANNRVVAWVNN